MAPKSSSTAPEMRTTAPTLSSRVGFPEGFTVTVAYACGAGDGFVAAPPTLAIPASCPRETVRIGVGSLGSKHTQMLPLEGPLSSDMEAA